MIPARYSNVPPSAWPPPAVGEGVADTGAPPGGAERAGHGGVERRRRPLALVLEEDLDGAAAELAAPRRRQGEPALDRHVRAQLVGSPRHGAQAITLRRADPARHNEHRPVPRRDSLRFLLEACMEPRPIPTTMTTMFEYDYATAEVDLRRLYENAK